MASASVIQRPGQVRHERDLRRAEESFFDQSGERLDHRVHHRGMESVRGRQAAADPTAGF